jgi:hypothetical protein
MRMKCIKAKDKLSMYSKSNEWINKGKRERGAAC